MLADLSTLVGVHGTPTDKHQRSTALAAPMAQPVRPIRSADIGAHRRLPAGTQAAATPHTETRPSQCQEQERKQGGGANARSSWPQGDLDGDTDHQMEDAAVTAASWPSPPPSTSQKQKQKQKQQQQQPVSLSKTGNLTPTRGGRAKQWRGRRLRVRAAPSVETPAGLAVEMGGLGIGLSMQDWKDSLMDSSASAAVGGGVSRPLEDPDYLSLESPLDDLCSPLPQPLPQQQQQQQRQQAQQAQKSAGRARALGEAVGTSGPASKCVPESRHGPQRSDSSGSSKVGSSSSTSSSVGGGSGDVPRTVVHLGNPGAPPVNLREARTLFAASTDAQHAEFGGDTN